MHAWQVGRTGEPGDVLERVQRPVPEPGEGEALVRVAAAGLGLPDVFMCRGTYAFSPPRPFVPGQEMCGTVVAAGADCDLAVGQRVMGVTAFYNGHGGLAEYCIAPDFSLYPVPDEMEDTEAAAFTIPCHTAWVGLVLRAGLSAGEVLLVHGAAGGTGAAGIRLGLALGADVIAVVGGAEKAATAREAGAQHVIDHRGKDFVAAVLELTGGRGADVVYDPVGGETFERSVDCTASGGRLLAVGFASGRWGAADSGRLVARNCAALGVYVGAHDHSELLECHHRLCELRAAGTLSPSPAQAVAFHEIGAALQRLGGRSVPGKLVADLNPE